MSNISQEISRLKTQEDKLRILYEKNNNILTSLKTFINNYEERLNVIEKQLKVLNNYMEDELRTKKSTDESCSSATNKPSKQNTISSNKLQSDIFDDFDDFDFLIT